MPSSPELRAVEERLRKRAEGNRSFLSTFGLELKAASLLALDGRDDHRHVLQRFLSRPAFEPILLHVWKELTVPAIGVEAMARFASGVTGHPVHLASGRMRTVASVTGEYTIYAPPEERALLPDVLRANAEADHASPVAAALIAYALTVLCHPVTDGNGRLARGVLIGTLGGCGLLKAPVVPLGPAFYMHGATVGATMARLSESGDWSQAVQELLPIVSTACDLADGVDRLT